ncbi:MAG: T9SS type A sorting domain-containing protein [Bacteroidales bacterium]
MKKFLLIIFLITSFCGYGQQKEWVREYKKGEFAVKREIVETYDQAFLLSGETGSPRNYSWIIKADINGNYLWSKELKSKFFLSISDHDTDKEGNIFIAGEKSGNPFVLKLNACGEFLWGKQIYFPESPADATNNLRILANGNILINLRYITDPIKKKIEEVGVLCLNAKGDPLWNYFYNSNNFIESDSDFVNDVILTQDQNLIISGYSYQTKPGTDIGVLKALLISVNGLNGEMNFYTFVDVNDFEGEFSHHQGYGLAVSEDGRTIFQGLALREIISDIQVQAPGMAIWDIDGNLLSKILIGEPKYRGRLDNLRVVDNNFFIGSYGNFKKSDFENDRNHELIPFKIEKHNKSKNVFKQEIRKFKGNVSAVLFDNKGNLKKEIGLNGNKAYSRVLKTNDDKFVFFTTITEDDDSRVMLYKFNKELEYDSIYTEARKYDYLCDKVIDDSPIEFGKFEKIEVNILAKTNILNTEYKRELKVIPNPVENICKIILPECIRNESNFQGSKVTQYRFKYQRNAQLEVLNSLGQKIYSESLNENQKELNVDVSSWDRGLYLARLVFDNKVVARVKIIKK